MAGGVELTTGSWLLASASLSWKISAWAPRLWLIACRSCSREYAPLRRCRISMQDLIALRFEFYVSFSASKSQYHAGSCLHRPYQYLLLPSNVVFRYTRIYVSSWTVGGTWCRLRRHTSCFRSVIFQVRHFPAIDNFWCVIFWSCKFSAPE